MTYLTKEQGNKRYRHGVLQMTNKMIEITCPECEGEGIVWYLDWLFYSGDHIEHEEMCSKCNGEGKILVDAEDYYYDHPEEEEE